MHTFSLTHIKSRLANETSKRVFVLRHIAESSLLQNTVGDGVDFLKAVVGRTGRTFDFALVLQAVLGLSTDADFSLQEVVFVALSTSLVLVVEFALVHRVGSTDGKTGIIAQKHFRLALHASGGVGEVQTTLSSRGVRLTQQSVAGEVKIIPAHRTLVRIQCISDAVFDLVLFFLAFQKCVQKVPFDALPAFQGVFLNHLADIVEFTVVDRNHVQTNSLVE